MPTPEDEIMANPLGLEKNEKGIQNYKAVKCLSQIMDTGVSLNTPRLYPTYLRLTCVIIICCTIILGSCKLSFQSL